MADNDQKVEEKIENPEQKEVKLTPIEEKAMAEGWVPQDEWDGDPDQWRPAKEFLDRGELFKKIEDQNRTIKEFKRVLEDMKQHNAKIREVEYKRALNALKEQKKEALENGDADSVIRLDDQIDLVKQEQIKLQNQPQNAVADEVNPELAAWIDKNKWYETDRAMKAYADDLGRELALRGQPPAEILKEVERQVKQEFAHKFRNPNRDKPGAVESSSGKGGKSKDDFVLSAEEQRIMERFVRAGAITREKYIEDLKATRGA